MPFFHGWLLVAIGFVTAVGVNAGTAFSLLFPPILNEFGWDSGITAGIFSFGFQVSALVTPFVGRLMDRRGPALVVELGVVAMAARLLLTPLVREVGDARERQILFKMWPKLPVTVQARSRCRSDSSVSARLGEGSTGIAMPSLRQIMFKI